MINYKDAGVDVEAGYESTRLLKEHVKKTLRPEVLSDIGSFGGLFSLAKYKYNNPVLVSGTDGVGTKLKIAFLMDKHDSVGVDCVAMCVNDIICNGAEPLFFLDYIAVGKNKPEKIAAIVKGVSEGCVDSGCAIVGGETAEMPGFYQEGEYDLVGFAVGIVDKEKIIDGKNIKKGDKLIGLPSTGLHSNGFSLVRKILNPNVKKMQEFIEAFGRTLGEELLEPTKIYVRTILDIKEKFEIKGISHITGGGFIENIPRIIPNGLRVKINSKTWPELPIFKLLERVGGFEKINMYNTFNMGIGMVIAVNNESAENIVKYLDEQNEKAYIIGEIIEGESGVDIC
ncbi:MAG: phosphoribosylformylglycinamidine cyclo-ligase [Clostridiales bacterium]